MVTILAQDTGTPDWYEKALMDGFGVYLSVPKTIEEIDRKIGFFSWALCKNFPGTFLLFLDEGNCSQEVLAHAHALVQTVTCAKVISGGADTSRGILMFSTATIDTDVLTIRAAVKERSSADAPVVCKQDTESHVDEATLEGTLRRVVELVPDFIVTEHVHLARACVPRKETALVTRVVGKVAERLQHVLKSSFARALYFYEDRRREFISFEARPMFAGAYTAEPNQYTSFPSCAVVIQGPLQLEHDFTVETAALYAKIFPTATIIVSTWKGEDASALTRLRNAGVTIVESDLPKERGVYNVNLQLFSAAQGVTEAKRLGVAYILKHRSDQRIYSAVTLEMMVSLLAVFPPGKKSNQIKRIIFGNGGPSLRPYWMSEILFGATEDIVEYYSAAPAGEKKDYYFILPELYLPTEFLKKKGWQLDWTIAQGIEVYRECFIPLDWTMLDLYWHKYWRFESNQQRRYKAQSPSHVLVTFGEWLALYAAPDTRKPNPLQRFVFEIKKK